MTNRLHCFSTLGCSELSLREAAALAGQFSIPALELRTISGSLDVPGALKAEFGSPEAFGRWMKASGVTILGLGTSARLFGDGFDLAEIEPFLPWAVVAGTPYLRVFDGGNVLDGIHYAMAAERLSQWQDYRRSHGLAVDLMIETHDALTDAGQLAAFARRLPQAKILWDSHHTWAKGGAELHATWSVIAPQVVHIHVKDSIPAAKGPEYVLPGHGTFPIRTLLDLVPPAIPVSLEWERHWHKQLPPLADALAAARGWW